jgi:ATP-dependent DNA helicase RecQ
MEFVYDTIERSRRRSLREMWLAARESASKGQDADKELRRRILDFLSEGDLMPGIEALVDSQEFSFVKWQQLWSMMTTANEAREWRAASARLLASYPAHPGLLAGRGLAELIDVDGNLAEFEFNLLQSLEESAKNYGVDGKGLADFGKWLLSTVRKRNPSAIGAVCTLLDYSGVKFDELNECIDSESTGDDISLAILAMSRSIDSALVSADKVLSNIN